MKNQDFAILTLETQEKVNGKWFTVESEQKTISKEFYNNITDEKQSDSSVLWVVLKPCNGTIPKWAIFQFGFYPRVRIVKQESLEHLKFYNRKGV